MFDLEELARADDALSRMSDDSVDTTSDEGTDE